MALFASPFGESSLYGPEKPFQNLFRMLDEFDTYNRRQPGTNEAGERSKRLAAVRTFNPKFDVRETKEAYELHGELPGIDRDQIDIQFTEPQTLVISGHVERSYTSGNPPAGLLEHDEDGHRAIEQGGSHQPTVEDEDAPADEDKTVGKHLAKSDTSQAQKVDDKGQQPTDKLWLSERAVGSFTRTFGFPTRVDRDAVKAGLENGVLTITVPKAKKQESRRITIN